MKVGDFIRHTTDGIQKIDNFVYANGIEFARCTNGCDYRVKNIIKCSPDPISLVEEGDYINGHLIVKKYNDKQFLIEDYTKPERVVFVNNNEIKTVLTKEQYLTHAYDNDHCE